MPTSEVANEAAKAWDTKLVQEAPTGFADNIGFERKGMAEVGRIKLVSTVASVAHAQARGLDPEVLRASDKELDEQSLAIARETVGRGNAAFRVDHDGVTRLD